jgi:hypothetical protein
LQVNSESMKSCCASCVAKHISTSDMSALGTIPTADEGKAEMISTFQACLYVAGKGMKAEKREEEGGRRCGAANCSRLTAHSVGWNAGGFCLRATCAHVGPVAMENT